MSDEPPQSTLQHVSITLSPTQVDEVVRAATGSRGPSLASLIADSLQVPFDGESAAGSPSALAEEDPSRPHAPRSPVGYLPNETTDTRLSRSLLRGLSILTCFGPGGASRGIVELAGDLGMSPSTAHRYALTLVELGLLERCPKTRKYSLPSLRL